ncbi:hypothetical protein VPH35_019227 [Triticum aestivum]
MDVESNARAIAEAGRDCTKLPLALIPGGVCQAAAALRLFIFKKPDGMFLHHGKVAFYLYYALLTAVALFGFVEASLGFWVARDLHDHRRQAYGRVAMVVSVLFLVLVGGLGGFAMPKY